MCAERNWVLCVCFNFNTFSYGTSSHIPESITNGRPTREFPHFFHRNPINSHFVPLICHKTFQFSYEFGNNANGCCQFWWQCCDENGPNESHFANVTISTDYFFGRSDSCQCKLPANTAPVASMRAGDRGRRRAFIKAWKVHLGLWTRVWNVKQHDR